MKGLPKPSFLRFSITRLQLELGSALQCVNDFGQTAYDGVSKALDGQLHYKSRDFERDSIEVLAADIRFATQQEVGNSPVSLARWDYF